jgi:2-keto-4-pentenoate hydratase/2-oxohepta-3-ene-1,7-dioic acid hydratase in catechol pathway
MGLERPGIVGGDGRFRDLSQHVSDIGFAELSPAGLAHLRAIDTSKLPLITNGARLGIPFVGTRQFIAIGLNYSDHARESHLEIPKEPVLFYKPVSCLQGSNDPIVLPRGSQKTDWEVELAVVVGSAGSYISSERALDHVAGYCVANDVSERAYQFERGGTWDKGKGCPTFGPVGPWLVTTDEVPDPQDLDMWLDVNGKRVQNGNTKTMMFGVATLVSYVSQFVKLLPADILITGTPPGVGMGQKPSPWYLKAGDVVTLGIEKLGEQRQLVLPSAEQ